MDIYNIFYHEIKAVASNLGYGDLPNLVVEPVKNFAHGDIATNLAMIVASIKKKKLMKF